MDGGVSHREMLRFSERNIFSNFGRNEMEILEIRDASINNFSTSEPRIYFVSFSQPIKPMIRLFAVFKIIF